MAKRRCVGRPRGISGKQWPEIIERYRSGELLQVLAKEFGVGISTISKYINEEGVKYDNRDKSPPIRDVNLRDFASAARSILWRSSKTQGEHLLYDTWKARVGEFRTRHGCSYGAAVVQATKECKLLWRLFEKYNVEQFDKYPDSHPGITRYGQQRKAEGATPKAVSEEIEQSYTENLAWAIEAAGECQRTGVPIESCPNDTAFFLYQQALASPKDFLARFSMAEARVGATDASDRLAVKRADDEIDSMLGTILDDTDEEGEAVVTRLA